MPSELAVFLGNYIETLCDRVADNLELETKFSDGNLEPGRRYGIISLSEDEFNSGLARPTRPSASIPYRINFDILVILCIDGIERPSQAKLNGIIMQEIISLREALEINPILTGREDSPALIAECYPTASFSVRAMRQQVSPSNTSRGNAPRHWELNIVGGFAVDILINNPPSFEAHPFG